MNVIHARLFPRNGFVGLTKNACGQCGVQMLGTRDGEKWRRLMGHPWHHDGYAWWCEECLHEAGYDTLLGCLHSNGEVRSRSPKSEAVGTRVQDWL